MLKWAVGANCETPTTTRATFKFLSSEHRTSQNGKENDENLNNNMFNRLSRGPLGDVTNQSPTVTLSPKAKVTPARTKSRLRRNLIRSKSVNESEKNKCSSCNTTTPRRSILKRALKRRKEYVAEYNVSPLKPSDLCIEHLSPDLLMADNPIYFTTSPLRNDFSNLKISINDSPNKTERVRRLSESNINNSSTTIVSEGRRNRRNSESNIEPILKGAVASAITTSSAFNTLPTPRLTPDLVASCWRPNSIVSCSSSSEVTWNSHKFQTLLKHQLNFNDSDNTPPMLEIKNILPSPDINEIVKNAKITNLVNNNNKNKKLVTNNKTDDIIDIIDKVLSEQSPLALVEKNSRSRKCLLYASPSTRKRKKSSSNSTNRGEIKLALYENSGLVTVHIISASNVPQRDNTKPASAFIKICLLPRRSEAYRTNVRRASSNAPVYRFDQKFSLELSDLNEQQRILISLWLRPRSEKHRKSECIGCMSFAVDDVLKKKEIRGSFFVLSPSAGRSQYIAVNNRNNSGINKAMAEQQSDSSLDEAVTPKKLDRRRSAYRKSYPSTSTANEDSIFLKHLELEPPNTNDGRTPFTTTRKLSKKQGSGFGFSVAWTQPPRVERVEAGLPADKSGLRPGDYIIFVGSQNVVTMPEEEILNLIKLSGNNLTLEVYRRTSSSCTTAGLHVNSPVVIPPPTQRRSASVTDCSAATSTDQLKRRLQLPQVAFTTEGGITIEEARKRAIYQLLQRLQQFALALHFGVDRFLVPLSDRKDLLSSTDHLTLFQNIEELLMLTEELLEQLVSEDAEHMGSMLGRIYLNKIQALTTAYRKYCLGLKKADCLLAEKARHPDFLRVTNEPIIPKRRPDLTTFIHKPLEHYRETLKLLQTVLKNSKVIDDAEYSALSKVVLSLQTTYRDITANSGLMEPEGDGRPLLSLQDLESRLVFTKCKPFSLSANGRQWIFGGDLQRVEGRTLRPFWALLFTDLLLLAKVSRDRVLFVTDEPLSLLHVTQACFNVKKKETEFRLILDGGPPPSPAADGKTKSSSKSRRRSVAFRAPTPELKAVWQNLLQRQIIYLNTVRGGTPSASPLDSPAEQPSLATMDSSSRLQLGSSQRQLDLLIEQKCRLLGKSGLQRGSALHLQQWITGQLGLNNVNQTPASPEEPEPEVWSPGTLRKRTEQLLGGGLKGRPESRCEELELSDTERSPSRSTDDSQITVKSQSGYAIVKVNNEQEAEKKTTTTVVNGRKIEPENVTASPLKRDSESSDYDSEECDKWEPLPSELGISLQNRLSATSDDIPMIAVVPPTPSETTSVENTPTPSHKDTFDWEEKDLVEAVEECSNNLPDNEEQKLYRSGSNSNLKKYGTLASLENINEAVNEEAVSESTTTEDDVEATCSYATVKYEKSETSSGSSEFMQVHLSSSVAEKSRFYEKLTEQAKENHIFIDSYSRHIASSSGFGIPRTISSSCVIPGNESPQAPPRYKKAMTILNHIIPTPATIAHPVTRHTVVMGTCATLKSKPPAVPVRSKIYAPFKPKAPAIPAKPANFIKHNLTSSAFANSPENSDKEEGWATPEGGEPGDDTEEELSSTQDIVSLFPCVGSDRPWSPDDDDQLNRILSAPPRVYPRRRLEPLYEEDGDGETLRPRPRLLSDSSSSGNSSPERPRPKVPPRRGYLVPENESWADIQQFEVTPQLQQNKLENSDVSPVSSGLLHRLINRTRKVGGLEQRKLNNLRGNNRSEENRSLLKLFSHSTNLTNNTNKILSTVRPDQDKILDRRFWKQLKRRRAQLNSSNSNNPSITV